MWLLWYLDVENVCSKWRTAMQPNGNITFNFASATNRLFILQFKWSCHSPKDHSTAQQVILQHDRSYHSSKDHITTRQVISQSDRSYHSSKGNITTRQVISQLERSYYNPKFISKRSFENTQSVCDETAVLSQNPTSMTRSYHSSKKSYYNLTGHVTAREVTWEHTTSWRWDSCFVAKSDLPDNLLRWWKLLSKVDLFPLSLGIPTLTLTTRMWLTLKELTDCPCPLCRSSALSVPPEVPFLKNHRDIWIWPLASRPRAREASVQSAHLERQWMLVRHYHNEPLALPTSFKASLMTVSSSQ